MTGQGKAFARALRRSRQGETAAAWGTGGGDESSGGPARAGSVHKEPARDRERGEDGEGGHESQDEGKGWLRNRQESPKMPPGIQPMDTAFGKSWIKHSCTSLRPPGISQSLLRNWRSGQKKIFFLSKSERIRFWKGTPIPLLTSYINFSKIFTFYELQFLFL